MAGTYSITENKTDAYKFRAMVSFNGKSEEYYEVDSLDPTEIAAVLQATADSDAERMVNDASMDPFNIVNGKIVL